MWRGAIAGGAPVTGGEHGFKYACLERFLSRLPSDRREVSLTLTQIDDLLRAAGEDPLPDSAHRHRPWWANETASTRTLMGRAGTIRRRTSPGRISTRSSWRGSPARFGRTMSIQSFVTISTTTAEYCPFGPRSSFSRSECSPSLRDEAPVCRPADPEPVTGNDKWRPGLTAEGGVHHSQRAGEALRRKAPADNTGSSPSTLPCSSTR